MFCLTCDFKIWLTVFNQRYNCQTSHYLGRNRLPNAFLMLPSLCKWKLSMSSIVRLWKRVWKENRFPGKVEPILIIRQILGGPETQMVSKLVTRKRTQCTHWLKKPIKLEISWIYCPFPGFFFRPKVPIIRLSQAKHKEKWRKNAFAPSHLSC